jgi:hypothetical protein
MTTNKRHGVDAGGAFCFYAGHHWPGTTQHKRWPPSRSAISKTPTVFRNKAQGSPLFPNDKKLPRIWNNPPQPKTLKLRNLRKSGVPWVNVSSILFFNGAARSSQPFVSAPLKNLGSPPLRHVDKTPSSQQDSRMKRLILRCFTFSRGTSNDCGRYLDLQRPALWRTASGRTA